MRPGVFFSGFSTRRDLLEALLLHKCKSSCRKSKSLPIYHGSCWVEDILQARRVLTSQDFCNRPISDLHTVRTAAGPTFSCTRWSFSDFSAVLVGAHTHAQGGFRSVVLHRECGTVGEVVQH